MPSCSIQGSGRQASTCDQRLCCDGRPTWRTSARPCCCRCSSSGAGCSSATMLCSPSLRARMSATGCEGGRLQMCAGPQLHMAAVHRLVFKIHRGMCQSMPHWGVSIEDPPVVGACKHPSAGPISLGATNNTPPARPLTTEDVCSKARPHVRLTRAVPDPPLPAARLAACDAGGGEVAAAAAAGVRGRCCSDACHAAAVGPEPLAFAAASVGAAVEAGRRARLLLPAGQECAVVALQLGEQSMFLKKATSYKQPGWPACRSIMPAAHLAGSLASDMARARQ